MSFGFSIQYLDRFDSRQNWHFDLFTLGLATHFSHHRQFAVGTGADHELVAFPGYVFFNGQRRMAKLIAKLLG